MKTVYRFALAIGVLWLSACATSPLDMDALNAAQINNFRAPEARVLSSGQPTRDQLEVMAAAGVRHVVNLRTPQEEVDFEERAVVESLGMTYHSIPVAGGGGVNNVNARSLQRILDDVGNDPILVHCATGNRVGGLFAINAFADGTSVEGAMAEGQRWGLSSERLQQVVRENLESN